MQRAIVAGTWASFSRTVAAAAIGSWLAFAICPAAFAADGPQAAAAKEAAAKLQAYLRDLKKSKGQPDYSRPPASEYLKRIFDADTLAALPPPKAEDLRGCLIGLRPLATRSRPWSCLVQKTNLTPDGAWHWHGTCREITTPLSMQWLPDRAYARGQQTQ
jgi:hypothetical protein